MKARQEKQEKVSDMKIPHETSFSHENPVEHALMVKASEADDNRLVG